MSNTPQIINASRSPSYIAGRKIFIQGRFDDGFNELIGNVSNMVDGLEWRPAPQINLSQITNPYNIDPDVPVIDVYISSGGGEDAKLMSLMTQLNLARARGAIIRTTVMSHACSCASALAIQGTPGFRIMYENSYNLIHYGRNNFSIDREGEAKQALKNAEEHSRMFNQVYLKYTSLTPRELEKFMHTEQGQIFPTECLKKKLCDWILTSDGTFLRRGGKSR